MIRIEHLCLSPGHNYFGRHGMLPEKHPVVPVDAIECIAGRGIRGDRFFDYKPDYKGQITFFAMEVFERMFVELAIGEVSPTVVRRNVFTRGLDLGALVGVEFEVQGVHFYGAEECRPCYWMDQAVALGTEAWLRGRGGLRARILSNGRLQTTDVQSPLCVH